MTFHGQGFLRLALADVAPLAGNVYSGFGFRSTQDSGLLYHRPSPVRVCHPGSDRLPAPLNALQQQRPAGAWVAGGRESEPLAWSPDLAAVPRMDHARCPCSRVV